LKNAGLKKKISLVSVIGFKWVSGVVSVSRY